MQRFSEGKHHTVLVQRYCMVRNGRWIYIGPKILGRQSSSRDLRDPSHQFSLYISDVILFFQQIILLTLCLKLNGSFFFVYFNMPTSFLFNNCGIL